MIKRFLIALGVLLCGALEHADATTADQVITGFESLGCPAGSVTPCFIPYAGADVLNITAATVVKATAGRLVRVSIITTGSTAGGCYDVATTGAAATANQVLVIPASTAAGTVYNMDFPMATGIVCTPGTSGVLAVSFD